MAYTIIPVVSILIASVAIVAAIASFLKCRSKDEDQQPRYTTTISYCSPARLSAIKCLKSFLLVSFQGPIPSFLILHTTEIGELGDEANSYTILNSLTFCYRQDSSLIHNPRPRPDLGGQLYRNTGYHCC